MALINCKECGREISDKASMCPGCGCPLSTKSRNEAIINTSVNSGFVLTEREKETLKNVENKIYNTYHHPKNKEAFPIALVFGVIAIIFKGAITWEILIWGSYYCYCSSNNAKWKNSPHNVKEREFLLNFRYKLLNGELREHYKE